MGTPDNVDSHHALYGAVTVVLPVIPSTRSPDSYETCERVHLQSTQCVQAVLKISTGVSSPAAVLGADGVVW
jgi:hypothetical protein